MPSLKELIDRQNKQIQSKNDIQFKIINQQISSRNNSPMINLEASSPYGRIFN
jgi:hypothetical protein